MVYKLYLDQKLTLTKKIIELLVGNRVACTLAGKTLKSSARKLHTSISTKFSNKLFNTVIIIYFSLLRLSPVDEIWPLSVPPASHRLNTVLLI